MEIPRLAIIGIDSMDRNLLLQFRDVMPNLTRLMKEGVLIQSESTMPPDSVTAWATLYTGLNPAEHGMVYFADPLDKVEATVANDVDNSRLRNNTFWDDASRAGKRVCVINPHLGYPPWPVNGIMIGRSSVKEDVISCPDGAVPRSTLAGLNCLKGVPKRGFGGLREAVSRAEELLDNETSFSTSMAESEDWDLFFVYSSVLDWIQHNFWSHYDPRDPGYRASTPFKGVIMRFYQRYDDFIGEIAETISRDTSLVVVSDHGHGLRPVRRFNLNVLLQREGLLVNSHDSTIPSSVSRKIIESVRRGSIRLVNEFNLGNVGLKMLESFPQLRRNLMKSPNINWNESTAYVSDLSGIKAYNYGGVIVKNPEGSLHEYESMRDLVIRLIEEAADPATGLPIAKWAIRREGLYQGEFIERYPDIVSLLNDDYGFGWNAEGDVLDIAETHNIQPGSHKIDTPVMLVRPSEEHKSIPKDTDSGRPTRFRSMVSELLGGLT